jgi:hypothetical protein
VLYVSLQIETSILEKYSSENLSQGSAALGKVRRLSEDDDDFDGSEYQGMVRERRDSAYVGVKAIREEMGDTFVKASDRVILHGIISKVSMGLVISPEWGSGDANAAFSPGTMLFSVVLGDTVMPSAAQDESALPAPVLAARRQSSRRLETMRPVVSAYQVWILMPYYYYALMTCLSDRMGGGGDYIVPADDIEVHREAHYRLHSDRAPRAESFSEGNQRQAVCRHLARRMARYSFREQLHENRCPAGTWKPLHQYNSFCALS